MIRWTVPDRLGTPRIRICEEPAPSIFAPMRVEAGGQVDDLGLARGIGDHRLALGERRGHHQVLGRADRRLREADLGAPEPLRGARVDIALVQLDRGAHPLEPLEMEIDRPRADRAAAGQRHPGPPARASSGPSTSTEARILRTRS